MTIARGRRLGLGVGALLLASTSLAGAQTLKVVPQADLKNLDPIWTTAAITQNHGYMIYDTLFALDEKLEPRPQMVEKHSVSDDGLTWTFTLREGLEFHDGTPVEAKDVVASLKRWNVKRAGGQALAAVTEAMTAKDARTVEIKLKSRFGPMLGVLADPALPTFVMREKDAQTDPNTQVTETVGSGPFIFVKEEWKPGDTVVYRKNPKYKPRSDAPSGFAGAKIPKIDRVEWKYIPDTNTATQALIAGEVDVYEIPPMDLMAMLEADPNIVVKVLDPLGKMGHIRPNNLHPPFNDPKARAALQLLVDQREFLAAQVGNPKYEKVCHAVFMCDAPFTTQAHTAAWTKPDKAKAKQLLAEAGYNFKDPIVVLVPTDQQIIMNNVLVMVGLLKEIGVNVDAQSMDWSTLTSRRTKMENPNTDPKVGWHIFPTWWTGVPMSSPITNAPLVASGDPKTAWFGWPKDEEIERLRAEFLRADGRDAQMKVIEALQKRYYETFPYINTGQFVTPVAWRKSLKGVPNALLFVAWNVEKG